MKHIRFVWITIVSICLVILFCCVANAQDREIELDVSSSWFPEKEIDDYLAIVKIKGERGVEVGVGAQFIEGTDPAYLYHLGYRYEGDGGLSIGVYVTPIIDTLIFGKITIGYKL